MIHESQLESTVTARPDPRREPGRAVVGPGEDQRRPRLSIIDDPTTGLAAPYVSGLTVNLLFSDGPERDRRIRSRQFVTCIGSNRGWRADVTCLNQPPAPDYMSPTFESDWFAFIHAVAHYSYNASAMAPHIGYIRFAIALGSRRSGALDTGARRLPGRMEEGAGGFSYDGWVQHAKNVVDAMGHQSPDAVARRA